MNLGALIVYDITDVDSFKRMEQWMKELKTYLPEGTPILIVGNKCDLPNRQISIEDAEAYSYFSPKQVLSPNL